MEEFTKSYLKSLEKKLPTDSRQQTKIPILFQTILPHSAFHAWLSHRNSRAECDADKCPEILLEDLDSTQLNKWLAVYTAEIKKLMVTHTLCGHFSLCSLVFYDIWDTSSQHLCKNDPSFRELHCTVRLHYGLIIQKIEIKRYWSREALSRAVYDGWWKQALVTWCIGYSLSSLIASSILLQRQNFVYRVVTSTGIWRYLSLE